MNTNGYSQPAETECALHYRVRLELINTRDEGRDDMMRDFLFAWRTLLHRKGFTAIAVLTLALGVGASTGMFSVIRSTLMRPLAFRDPDALVFIQGTFGPERQVRGSSYPESMNWRASARGFTTMSVYDAPSANLSGEGEAEQVPAELVSATFFDMLGVGPRLGRGLQAGDDVAGGPKVVVLSHDLWRRRFGGEAGVLGKSLVVNGVPLTIVGVMPEGFRGISFQA